MATLVLCIVFSASAAPFNPAGFQQFDSSAFQHAVTNKIAAFQSHNSLSFSDAVRNHWSRQSSSNSSSSSTFWAAVNSTYGATVYSALQRTSVGAGALNGRLFVAARQDVVTAVGSANSSVSVFAINATVLYGGANSSVFAAAQNASVYAAAANSSVTAFASNSTVLVAVDNSNVYLYVTNSTVAVAAHGSKVTVVAQNSTVTYVQSNSTVYVFGGNNTVHRHHARAGFKLVNVHESLAPLVHAHNEQQQQLEAHDNWSQMADLKMWRNHEEVVFDEESQNL